jgi:hypothetical protein
MNKSLPAVRFITVFNHFIHSRSVILIILLITALSYNAINAQESSVGPAPVSIVKINHETRPLTIGTRAFHLISSSPTFTLAKSFMESCTTINIGAPFTMTFPGGLVLKNGVLYTWNAASPFQLYTIDTVTGVYTLLGNITGIPMPNLTGMCWDGTTMYAVCTNISSSQLLGLNTATRVCTPIGTPSAGCPGAVCLFGRMFAGSSLYSYDMVNDDLFRWNKTTGAATLLGPAGFTINSGMGACFDGNTAYINANSQLRRWDTTGGGALLCTYTSNPIGIACVPSLLPFPGQLETLCRNGLNVAVPDASPVGARDTIRFVSPNNYPVKDINVRIDTFLHTWDSDMSFTLNHNSVSVLLIANRGGSGDNFIGTVLNDSAFIPISSGTAPFTGQFRPEQPLNVFNGLLVNGPWVLFMEDNAGGDLGFLHAWCIEFQLNTVDGGIIKYEIPFAYKLSQNYPNPFNPVTTIKCGLPKFGKTNLVVYDILGRVVTKLVDNEFKDAGTYEVKWDASNFSSGIYFYTLESGSYKETMKMVLIK